MRADPLTGAPVTPRAAGLRLPAEWAPHERTLMAWPARFELWGTAWEQAKRDYAAIARAIAAFEPVLMVAPPGARADVRRRCGRGVDVVEIPIDDSWMRDSGPIVVSGADGRRGGVDFRFNGWGEKFTPYDRDDAMSSVLLERLGIERFEAPLVLEGGSITVDGDGTLIATEQCLLHPSRNPSLSRDQIERLLGEYLGVDVVVWIPNGLSQDRDTDGHVDNVAQFAGPGRVVAQAVPDPASPDHERMAANLERLRAAGLEVITLDELPATDVRGAPGCCPYTNFYVCNDAVIVPVTEEDPDRDADALAAIGAAFGREAVPAPGRLLAEGGGGVHCITQQVPLAWS
jgi:agmatine deiminase